MEKWKAKYAFHYTREMLAIEVDTSLPALRVVRMLERLRLTRGLPERIVIDNVLTLEGKSWREEKIP